MNNNEKVEITPEAGNFILTLRNIGYDNVPAIEDLIDNSIDADAKNIWIIINDLKRIIIADDGVGMSYETLRRSLRLGGRKNHNASDLGKYGVGMITGSFSIGPKFTIITKHEGAFCTAICDCEEINQTNEFVATVRESNELEIASFMKRTNNAESGTVLIIDDCDKIQYSTVESFVRALKSSAKRVFRNFIRDGKKSIYINDVMLQMDDPLMLSGMGTEIRLDKTVDVELEKGSTEKLRILAVTLAPNKIGTKNSERLTSIKTQGFYALRNNREMAAAFEIPEVFKKHNDYNLFRIELQFGPGLDDEMNVNFSKHNVSPSSRIVNILVRELADIAHKVRDEAKARQKKNSERRKKAKNPFGPDEPGNDGRNDKNDNTDNTDGEGNDANGFTQIPVEGAGKKTGIEGRETLIPEAGGETEVVFEGIKNSLRFKTEEDALFEVTVSPESASILYNGANPFYRDRVVNNDDGAELKKFIDVLVESVINSCVKNNIAPKVTEQICNDIAVELVKEKS